MMISAISSSGRVSRMSAMPQNQPRFSSEPEEPSPKSRYGKPDFRAAAFVLAALAGFAATILFGPAIKDRFFPGKDNCPPRTTQQQNQGNDNPVDLVK